MGHGCLVDKDCCGKLICSRAYTGARMCTRACTPDNISTALVNEDDCPDAPNKFICADIATPPVRTYRCLKRCIPAKGVHTCPAGLACSPRSTLMTRSTDRAACGFPMCKTGKDCPVFLNKVCSTIVTWPQCVGHSSGTFCAPIYVGSFSGRCARAGACDTTSGLCAPHTLGKSSASVGDPCKSDTDCAGQMECLQEVATGGTVYNRNGYCAIQGCNFDSTYPDAACPKGSTCLTIYYGGRCLKTCDLQKPASCRGHAKDRYGDYECRAWNQYFRTRGTLAKTPVCQPGYSTPCNNIAFSTGLKIECKTLGLSGNSTQMLCRDPATGKVLPTYSPSGTCLDTSASGP
jgi:hypothetical protein